MNRWELDYDVLDCVRTEYNGNVYGIMFPESNSYNSYLLYEYTDGDDKEIDIFETLQDAVEYFEDNIK